MLTYWKCDSTTRAEEIQALFVRNDRPAFPAFFKRAYPTLAAAGGASWIATDEQGTVVMHLALFPRSFRGIEQSFRVGLLGDLMADVPYRDFWSPLKLFRRAIADIRREGTFDFLYTDPSPNSVAIVKAAGFTPLGELRRYVAPVNPLYLAYCGMRSGITRTRTDCREQLGEAGSAALAAYTGRQLGAARSTEFYEAHTGGELAPTAHYVVVRPRDAADHPPTAVGMLAAPGRGDTAALIDLQWDEQRLGVESALHAVAHAARAQGFRKLSCATLNGSRFAQSLADYGFIGRECIQPMFVLPLRPAQPLPNPPDWMLTSLDGSAW